MIDGSLSAETHAPDTTTPTRARGSQRRDQILDVALRLFAQKGMAHVTTRQIAQAVGISQPSLYAHFRNADEIGAELCARAFETLTARMAQCAHAPLEPHARLAQMGRAYIEFGLDNPDMYRVAFMLEDMKPCEAELTIIDGEPSDPVLAAGLRCFSVMHEVVASILPDDPEQALLTAQLVWAHVHGLVSLLIARPEFPWGQREALIDAHVARLPV